MTIAEQFTALARYKNGCPSGDTVHPALEYLSIVLKPNLVTQAKVESHCRTLTLRNQGVTVVCVQEITLSD